MYENPLTVNGTTTIKAVAYDGNDTPSNVTAANYYFCSADDPYTVTDALAFAEYQYPANGIYVTGIVSTAPAQAQPTMVSLPIISQLMARPLVNWKSIKAKA